MEEEDIEKLVINYLKKKGFKQAELAFQEELQQQSQPNSTSNSLSDPDIAKLVLSFNEYLIFSLILCSVVLSWPSEKSSSFVSLA